MSRTIYDFLLNSFLLDQDALEGNYSKFSDAEIERELDNYRSYVIENLDQIRGEVTLNQNKLNGYFRAAFQAKLDDPTLTKAVLYFDNLVLDDPLFPLTKKQPEGSEAFAKFFGYQSPSQVDRADLVNASKLLKIYQPLVGADILKLAPISISHERPEQIHLSYSEKLFAERVPEELIGWFHKHAIVKPVRKVGNDAWGIFDNDELSPCRAIGISFKGHYQPMVFHLTAIKAEKNENNQSIVKFEQWIPDTPPDENQFNAWISQSINQYAGRLYRIVATDLVNAGLTHSMLMTDSDFLSDLLAVQFNKSGTVNEDILKLYFNFDLPFIENISLHDVINVRKNEGEAFEKYRITLQKELRSLRHIDDDYKIQKKIEDLNHEINDVQLKEIELSIKKLKQRIFASALVGIARLVTVIPSKGTSLGALILSGAKLYKERLYYLHELKGNPAYFLWRIKKRTSNRIT